MLLCAIPPDAPEAPTTTVIGGVVIVDWPSTLDNGSEIINYKVFIQVDGSNDFVIENAECDGTQPQVLENRYCEI